MGPQISIQVDGVNYTAIIVGPEDTEESVEPEQKQTSLECHVCKRKYKTAKALKSHIKLHKFRNIKIYKCKDCGKRYFGERRFHIHQTLHFDHRSVKCVICSCLLQDRRKFKLHLKAHPYKDYEALGMSWDAVYEASVSSSTKLKTSQLVERCDICSRNVPMKYLRRHKIIIHADCMTKKEKRERYRYLRKKARPEIQNRKQNIISQRNSLTRGCHLCHLYFHRRNALDKHVKTVHSVTDGDFRCSFCNKIFQNHNHWIMHERLHTKRRPFQCTNCLSSFALESQLRFHASVHQVIQESSSPIKNFASDPISQGVAEEEPSEQEKPSTTKFEIEVITIPSDSECDSQAATITGTSDDEKSLSDFEDEVLLVGNDGDTPSPNLGNQQSESLCDLQDQLDFQELTLARHSFVSDNNGSKSNNEILRNDGLSASHDKFNDTMQFNREIESALTNGILYGDFSFFQDENETPNFDVLHEEPRNNEIVKGLETGLSSLVGINPHSVLPDPTMTSSGVPLYEMCVRVGTDGEEVQFSKQNNFSQKSHDFQCHTCDKSFESKLDLENHALCHGLPTFTCNTCGVTFNTKACLTVHETSHIEVESSVDGELPGRLVRRRRKRPFKRRGPRCDSTPAEIVLEGSSAVEKSTIRVDNLLPKATAIKDDEFACHYTFCGKKEGDVSADCYHCGRLFRSQRNFWSHQATHYGPKPFHCNICASGIRFRDLSAFRAHIDKEHGNARQSAKVFECSSCQQFSPTFENSFRPIIGGNVRSQRRAISTTFSCQFVFCGKPSGGLNGVTGAYECFRCDKMCETTEFLKKHEEIHSGPMPFPCNICGKCFTRVLDLQTHIRKHHNQKTLSLEMFACQICKNSYQGGLSEHRRILRTYPSRKQRNNVEPPTRELGIHLEDPQKSSKIDSTMSSSESPLIRLDEVMTLAGIITDIETSDHEDSTTVAVNTAEADTEILVTSLRDTPTSGSLKCPECDQQFTGYRKLNRHLKSHQPKDLTHKKLNEPAGCPFCKKTYKFIYTLQSHVDRCHPENQIFVCKPCAKFFELEDSYKSHSQTCH